MRYACAPPTKAATYRTIVLMTLLVMRSVKNGNLAARCRIQITPNNVRWARKPATQNRRVVSFQCIFFPRLGGQLQLELCLHTTPIGKAREQFLSFQWAEQDQCR